MAIAEAGKVAIPPPAQKTFDAEGETLEHALTKSLRVRTEAIKEPVLLRPPLQGRHRQTRMQKRLSARSSGVAESSRSGGRFDSELSHVRTIQTNQDEGRICGSGNFRHWAMDGFS